MFKKLIKEEIKLIKLGEDEHRIIAEMSNIEGIFDYFELQKQAGYVMYGKTDDKKYLGYVEMATTILNLFDKQRVRVEEPEPVSHREQGYEST